MYYYKWIQSNEPIITQIPYYVYTSLEEAYKHEEPHKTLYSFESIDPTPIKQELPKSLTTITPTTITPTTTELNQHNYYKILNHFNDKPRNHLLNTSNHQLQLMQNLCYHLGCLQTENTNTALYLWETTLTQENNFIVMQSKSDCFCSTAPATFTVSGSGVVPTVSLPYVALCQWKNTTTLCGLNYLVNLQVCFTCLGGTANDWILDFINLDFSGYQEARYTSGTTLCTPGAMSLFTYPPTIYCPGLTNWPSTLSVA